MTETETKRKSPETRATPMAKLVFVEPLPVPDAYAEQFAITKPRMAEGEGRLSSRNTKLAKEMVERVPRDRHWYVTAICYSSGEASGMASHISRGGYGRGVQVAHGLIPNANKRGMGREHAVLLNRHNS
jgi:hypothetical protein